MEKEHIKRISFVVKTMLNEGYRYLVDSLNLRLHVPLLSKIFKGNKLNIPPNPKRVRRLLERLGASYIKLGQLLSLRPDLIPPEYCQEFSKLQDNVRPMRFSTVKKIIKNDIRRKRLFKSIKRKPIGSASVAQVHEAKLYNGKKVVVKVQRPNVKKDFEADIDVMYYIAHRMEKYLKNLPFRPTEVVREFEKYTKEELDFNIEGNHIQKFRKNKASVRVKIPRYYPEYSNSKVLVMEYLEGVKLSQILKSKKKRDTQKIALHLFHICVKQVYSGDIFHADLHPGNVLVMKGGKLGFLDFGITGELTPKLREQGVRLYVALVDKNYDEIYNALMSLSYQEENADPKSFRKEIVNIVDEWYGRSLKEARITHTLHRLLNSGNKYGIKMPIDMVMFAKSLVTMEGTCIQLYPGFNFIEESKPYITDLLKTQFEVKGSLQNLMKKSLTIRDYLDKFPKQAISTMKAIEKGTFNIDISDSDIEYLGKSIDISSNRMSLALVSASFIIAGSMLVGLDIGPMILGYPLMAVISFAIACFMVGILMIELMRKG